MNRTWRRGCSWILWEEKHGWSNHGISLVVIICGDQSAEKKALRLEVLKKSVPLFRFHKKKHPRSRSGVAGFSYLYHPMSGPRASVLLRALDAADAREARREDLEDNVDEMYGRGVAWRKERDAEKELVEDAHAANTDLVNSRREDLEDARGKRQADKDARRGSMIARVMQAREDGEALAAVKATKDGSLRKDLVSRRKENLQLKADLQEQAREDHLDEYAKRQAIFEENRDAERAAAENKRERRARETARRRDEARQVRDEGDCSETRRGSRLIRVYDACWIYMLQTCHKQLLRLECVPWPTGHCRSTALFTHVYLRPRQFYLSVNRGVIGNALTTNVMMSAAYMTCALSMAPHTYYLQQAREAQKEEERLARQREADFAARDRDNAQRVAREQAEERRRVAREKNEARRAAAQDARLARERSRRAEQQSMRDDLENQKGGARDFQASQRAAEQARIQKYEALRNRPRTTRGIGGRFSPAKPKPPKQSRRPSLVAKAMIEEESRHPRPQQQANKPRPNKPKAKVRHPAPWVGSTGRHKPNGSATAAAATKPRGSAAAKGRSVEDHFDAWMKRD